jgi:hypothetical protein
MYWPFWGIPTDSLSGIRVKFHFMDLDLDLESGVTSLFDLTRIFLTRLKNPNLHFAPIQRVGSVSQEDHLAIITDHQMIFQEPWSVGRWTGQLHRLPRWNFWKNEGDVRLNASVLIERDTLKHTHSNSIARNLEELDIRSSHRVHKGSPRKYKPHVGIASMGLHYSPVETSLHADQRRWVQQTTSSFVLFRYERKSRNNQEWKWQQIRTHTDTQIHRDTLVELRLGDLTSNWLNNPDQIWHFDVCWRRTTWLWSCGLIAFLLASWHSSNDASVLTLFQALGVLFLANENMTVHCCMCMYRYLYVCWSDWFPCAIR